MLAQLSLFLSVVFGPWITSMGEDSFSVLWTSDKPSTACVKLENGRRFYEEFAGRHIHSTFHHVRVSGVKEGEIVNYSIAYRDLVDNSNARRPIYGEENVQGPYEVRTFSAGNASCRFSVMNDIHMDRESYSAMAGQIDSSNTDFVFLNGDIISAGHHSAEKLVEYEIAPMGHLAHGIPVMFARGNHEGRGDGVENVLKLFPNDNAELPFCRMFREGPAAFLVLDAGETGAKNSEAMNGSPIYEQYLKRQIEWTKTVTQCPEWKDALVRICFIHAPMIDFGIPGDYIVHGWMNHNFVPILNEAGVNFLIGADLHEQLWVPAGKMGNNFPILVNGRHNRVDVKIEGSRISADIYNDHGELQRSFTAL